MAVDTLYRHSWTTTGVVGAVVTKSIERLLHAQPGPPEDDDQTAEPAAMGAITGGAHDGDDLLDLRRVSRVAQSLVARHATRVESGHHRRRPATTGTIKPQL